MRIRTRRSSSVEIKSAGNRHTTVIPSRIRQLIILTPRLFRDRLVESAPSPAEPRRILQSLIMPELPPEPAPVIDDRLQRRRSRPRKAQGTVVEAACVESIAMEPEIIAEPPALARQMASARSPSSAKRLAKPGASIAPGERWKRRLGRWSR